MGGDLRFFHFLRMADVESSSAVQQPPSSTTNIIPLLAAAEILNENNSTTASTSNLSQQANMQANNGASNATNVTNTPSDEPPTKKQMLDHPSTSSSVCEKLESRLGGILCCAVCLDLPKTAMYQVSDALPILKYFTKEQRKTTSLWFIAINYTPIKYII